MQGIVRGLRVLEELAELQPAGVGELARRLGLPKSTVQRNLQALHAAGWIRPVEAEYTRWTLTTRALRVGLRGSPEGTMRELALGPMRELRDRTGETITLQVRDGLTQMVQIERVDSQQAVRSFVEIGTVSKLTVTSGGMAVLALLPAEETTQILAEPIEQRTARTITDPDRIRAELAKVRRLGYAVNLGQNRNDVCAVGAAIVDHAGTPIAGLGISMPVSRFARQRVAEWGRLVRDAAEAISAAL